jgi:hypothetical protein
MERVRTRHELFQITSQERFATAQVQLKCAELRRLLEHS